MRRLTHDRKAFLRSMQMSQCKVFSFVEGVRNDRFFYSEICRLPVSDANCSYRHILARELPGQGGGKQSLIEFFKFLREKNSLIDDFYGKRTGSIFFLDKDVDDFCRSKITSDHLIYTKFYDVENHLFVSGDVIKAGAACSGLDSAEVARTLQNPSDWRQRCNNAWKDWVMLCLFVRRRGINFGSNYGVNSKVNTDTYGALDLTAYSQFKSELQAAAGLSAPQFDRAFKRHSQEVDARYGLGEHDTVFKGKWYSGFLAHELTRAAPKGNLDTDALAKKIPAALALTVDFNGAWVEHFKVPIRRILAKVSA